MHRRDWLFVGRNHQEFNDPTGEHLTGDDLRNYLRGSDALREDARVRRITEEAALERLVEISERANAVSIRERATDMEGDRG